MENNEDPIKSAFCKVKEDINFLNNEILNIKIAINEIKQAINLMIQASTDRQTIRHINTTNPVYSTDNSTHYSTVPQETEGLKSLNLPISTGNQGVSTDRQTDNSTDRQTQNYLKKQPKSIEINLQEASEILNSLDSIKKEIRLKFKHLTSQEMSVFSTIYQLEEQNPNLEITYKQLSKQLKLSESSIRDYIQRMINKGIPIKKQKINNKKVFLTISSELKKIASLPTIIKLREL
jgi:biotin operon repressor